MGEGGKKGGEQWHKRDAVRREVDREELQEQISLPLQRRLELLSMVPLSVAFASFRSLGE